MSNYIPHIHRLGKVETRPVPPKRPIKHIASNCTLCLVVLAQSHETLALFPTTTLMSDIDELVMITNPGARFGGLGTIANRVLNQTSCDVFGIVHADTVFEKNALIQFATTAMNGKVCGMVGRQLNGKCIWSRNVKAEIAVSTLDSCSVFFPRKSGLQFDDKTFDSFHFVVEDLCLTAAQKGIDVVVPPAMAFHRELSTYNKEWLEECEVYRKKMIDKWAGVEFITTV